MYLISLSCFVIRMALSQFIGQSRVIIKPNYFNTNCKPVNNICRGKQNNVQVLLHPTTKQLLPCTYTLRYLFRNSKPRKLYSKFVPMQQIISPLSDSQNEMRIQVGTWSQRHRYRVLSKTSLKFCVGSIVKVRNFVS